MAVASCDVAAFADDFDDLSEGDSPSQPLPPEDRLWRHPSELGALGSSLPLDPITVRRRWLASQPSKASAWTAGLVGALLATGLVALGTHLAGAMTNRSSATPGNGTKTVLTSPTASEAGQRLSGVGTGLAAGIATAGKAVVTINVTRGTTTVRCLGVGVRSDGMLLAPAAEVLGATSIVVMLPDGTNYVGEVVGSDASTRAASSGLALVHINGVTDLPVATLKSSRPAASSTIGVAVTAPGGSTFAIGNVSAGGGATATGDAVLVDAMTTDISASMAPPGSILLGSDGQVIGIATGTRAGHLLATPAWIASMVAEKLESVGVVSHGWLGIDGATTSGAAIGVKITNVPAGSAAAEGGMRAGDTIVSVDSHRITSMTELQGRLYFVRPGEKVIIGIVRGGRDQLLHVVLNDQMK